MAAPELEIYVFPEDAQFHKVQGTNGGRIYYLRFQSYEDKHFFWIQEPDENKDTRIAKQVNDIINFDEEEEAAQ